MSNFVTAAFTFQKMGLADFFSSFTSTIYADLESKDTGDTKPAAAETEEKETGPKAEAEPEGEGEPEPEDVRVN